MIIKQVIIVFGCFCLKTADAVTKYACISYQGGSGIPGVVGPGLDLDGDGLLDSVHSPELNSASSEELGEFAFAGYGALQHGVAGGLGRVPITGQGIPPPPGTAPQSPASSASGSLGIAAAQSGNQMPNTAQSPVPGAHPPHNTPVHGAVPVGMQGILLTGSLSCIEKPQTTILITRLVYGNGGIYSCSSPDQNCDVVDYSDQEITPFCDGRTKCVIRTTGKTLPTCKQTSNFVHIEYECIYAWSTFNICNDVKTIVGDSEVLVASPNFFQASLPPSKTCECIVKGRYDERIMAQYVHTDIHMADDHSCPESYLLFESKGSENDTKLEKSTEVCGRRSLNNYLYRGTLRMTLKDTAKGKPSGFITKLLVPSSGFGASPQIAIECGPVRMEGEPVPPASNTSRPFMGIHHPHLGPYGPVGTINNQFGQSPRIPAPPTFEGSAPMNQPPVNYGGPPMKWGAGPPPGLNFVARHGPVYPFNPRFRSGPIIAPVQNDGPPPAWSRNQNPGSAPPATPATNNLGNGIDFLGKTNTPAPKTPPPKRPPSRPVRPRRRRPNRRRPGSPRGAARIQNQVTSNESGAANETGRMAGYIIGGIGAALTAFCGLFITLYCTRRRKQRIIERQASERRETGFENRTSCADNTPVYTLPSAFDHTHPSEREKKGHVNKTYVEDEKEPGEQSTEAGEHFENIVIHDEDDTYQSLDEVESMPSSKSVDDLPPRRLELDSKYCQSVELPKRRRHDDEAVYDNNV